MPSFMQLTKKKQTRFLSQFVDSISAFRDRAERSLRYGYGGRSCVFVREPSLVVTPEFFVWEYLLFDSHYDGYFSTRLRWDANKLWDDENLGEPAVRQSLRKELIGELSYYCDCTNKIHGLEMCAHVCLSIQYLEKQLEKKTTEEALEWIETKLVQPETLGSDLLDEIECVRNRRVAISELPATYRMQWRLDLQSPAGSKRPWLRLEPYLRKSRPGGKWSAGRRVRDLVALCPGDALSDTSDRTLALLYDANPNSFGYSSDGSLLPIGLARSFDILMTCSDVVWSSDPSRKVVFQEVEIEVALQECSSGFQPIIHIGGKPINGWSDVIEIGGDKFLGVVLDKDTPYVGYCAITASQKELLSRISRASSRGAVMTRAIAEKFTHVVLSGELKESIRLNLPEVLAGPEVTLEPKVELQLMPLHPGTMEARLRISSDVLLEPVVPGIGRNRIPVATPAGNFQLVRSMEEEIASAGAYADLLKMGGYAFEGPYTWRCESIDQTLGLIERVRALGEEAPLVTWPQSKALRVLGEITPQSLRVRLSSDKDWFGIDGELKLDGMQIPLAQLLASLRSGSRFVPLGDNQFATISDSLRARLTTIQDVSTTDSNWMKVSRAAAILVDEALGTDISAETDLRWQEAIQRLNDLEEAPSNPPAELCAELRDYQVAGYQWLSKLSRWGIGGCLADDMGLGKTVQALGVLLDRADQGPSLIVAPTSVGINWIRETKRFAPSLDAHLYSEHERDELIQSATSGQLIVISYQMLQRNIERIRSRRWATLVLDEAQYIKNFQTKTNQAVRELEVDWCLALSGTPLENHLGELWSLMRVVCPGLLGSWERFRKQFGEPIERDKDPERLQALGHVVRPFILRRTKQEVLKELPPRTEVVRLAEFSDAERKRYDAARMAALKDLSAENKNENDQQKRIRILAWITRLRQLACHPRLVDDRWDKSSAKLDLLMEIIEELRDNGHRALVFSQFVQHLTLVRETLDKLGVPYQYLDGSTPVSKRQAAVDAFQRGEGSLFLISLKAGGTGLNLTSADFVLHLDPWWNPAVEDQATDRAHRIGQTRSVTVYRLVAKDTIEEQILSLHEDKRALISGVLEGADRAAKLSTSDLISLIRDSQAIGQM